jgi:hypothetical protein
MQPQSSPGSANTLSPASIQLFRHGAIIATQVVTAVISRNGRGMEEAVVPFRSILVIEEEATTYGSKAWPLEVYNRDGLAINITLEPGKMLLVESGTVIHGVSSISRCKRQETILG